MGKGQLNFNELSIKSINEIREICNELPEVEESIDKFGHLSFRVKNKPFVIIGENEKIPSISIKTLPITQEILLGEEGYFKTPYIGQHGWTSFNTSDQTNWEVVRGFIIEAYNRTAPKRLQIHK